MLSGVVNNDNLTYAACRLDFNGRQCNKKVTDDDGTGMFYCQRCNQTCQPMYRYLLNLKYVDFTGALESVSAFGESGDAVMGMTADEAHQVCADRVHAMLLAALVGQSGLGALVPAPHFLARWPHGTLRPGILVDRAC